MQSAPGWRLWGLLLVSTLLACLVSIVASVKIADENAKAQLKRVEIAKEQATVEQRHAACQLIGNILDAYEETPPPSPAGKNVADAWRNEYAIAQCPPRK